MHGKFTTPEDPFTYWPDARRLDIPIADGTAYVTAPADVEWRLRDDGFHAPALFTYVEVPRDRSTPFYVLECVTDPKGRPELVALHVVKRPKTGREVRSSDLRALRSVEEILEVAGTAVLWRAHFGVADTFEEADAIMDGEHNADAPARRAIVQGLRKRAPRRVTDALLDEVAAVYRDALPTGKPTKAVLERFGFPPSTASLYVKRARESGRDMGDSNG